MFYGIQVWWLTGQPAGILGLLSCWKVHPHLILIVLVNCSRCCFFQSFWSSFLVVLGSWSTFLTNCPGRRSCAKPVDGGVMLLPLVDNDRNGAFMSWESVTSAIPMWLNNLVAKVMRELFAFLYPGLDMNFLRHLSFGQVTYVSLVHAQKSLVRNL